MQLSIFVSAGLMAERQEQTCIFEVPPVSMATYLSIERATIQYFQYSKLIPSVRLLE